LAIGKSLKFDRYWRIFATGLSFAIFGVFGTILTVLLLPVLLLTRESPARRKFGKLLLKLSFKSFLWGIQILGIVDLRTKNIDRLKTKGRLILANHPSLIDAIILFAIVDNPNGVIKSTLFNNPSMYGLAKIAGLMRNVEGPELIRKSIESISAGENLIIFPEGTRTKVLGQVTFKKGAAYIAIKGGFNIIPVFIVISEPFLRKNQSWYAAPLKKPVLTVSVLNEVHVATKVNTSDDLLIEASKLTKYFEKHFTHEFRVYE
jgi:1-acyl-sn-glycerol-3-phosphate acyltransferase